jgi:hypothetical protein
VRFGDTLRCVTSRLRVLVDGIGALGGPIVDAILERDELELAGVRIYSPEKDGRDVGTLRGGAEIGMHATLDPTAINADCVVYVPRTPSLDDVCAYLERGINVVTPSFLFAPDRIAEPGKSRLQQACETGQATVHASGINPGNLSGVLPLALSGMTRKIRKVHIQERGDWSYYASVDITFEQQAFGRPVEEINPEATPGIKHTSDLFSNQVWMLADALGADIDEVTVEVDAVAATKDHQIFDRELKAGTTGAQRWRWQGRKAGQTRVEIETLWTLGHEYPAHWPTPNDGWTLTIEGDPSMQVHTIVLASFTEPATMEQHVAASSVAAAMQVLNAVPVVYAHAPGFATSADLPLIRNASGFASG